MSDLTRLGRALFRRLIFLLRDDRYFERLHRLNLNTLRHDGPLLGYENQLQHVNEIELHTYFRRGMNLQLIIRTPRNLTRNDHYVINNGNVRGNEVNVTLFLYSGELRSFYSKFGFRLHSPRRRQPATALWRIMSFIPNDIRSIILLFLRAGSGGRVKRPAARCTMLRGTAKGSRMWSFPSRLVRCRRVYIPSRGLARLLPLTTATRTPTKPYNPHNPYKPMTPITPPNPITPINPYNPYNPMIPITPLNPITPINPYNPYNPYKPMSPLSPLSPLGSPTSFTFYGTIVTTLTTLILTFSTQSTSTFTTPTLISTSPTLITTIRTLPTTTITY